MILNDRVHGNWNIDNPVLCDLLDSPAMLRIGAVSQSGLMPEWDAHPVYWRREHCIGAMLAVRRLGASLDEQVASLLHDVSHTAFSHVIDYVFGSSKNADYQDRTHERYIRMHTNILDILDRHAIPADAALHPHKFTLLEQPAPALCADRVDYTLRGALNDGVIATAQPFVAALRQRDGRMVFAAQDIAEAFWKVYADRHEHNWSSPDHLARGNILAEAIRVALASGKLTTNDLYVTDQELTHKLRASEHPGVLRNLALLDNGFRIVPEKSKPDYVLTTKFRYIDPAFVQNGSIRTLSQVNPAYKDWLATARQRSAQGVPVRIVPV